MVRRLLWLGVVALPGLAHAQGIDCSKARSPTERAICASPGLLNLDHQVAVAYADALARQPERRDAMRQELLAWLRQRDAECRVPSGALEACLSRQLTRRLAALTPPASTAAVAAPAPVAAPAAPATAPAAPAAAPAPPAAPADPAIPHGFDQPAPAAHLDQASLPAGQASTLLHVTSPGRFAITAHSGGGTALQLIDMLTGPGEVAGAAGAQDGRLDVLLDVGDYKLLAFAGPGATGSARIDVTPSHPAAPPAALPLAGRTASATLMDGETRAYWLLVPPVTGPAAGPNVRIEAAGRSLADLRLWRDGRDLSALVPDARQIEPAPGHGLSDLLLAGQVEPGTYLVVAYGGRALGWSDGDAAQPFHLRSGVSPDLMEGWAGGAIGPFGSEAFTRPPSAALVELSLPTAAAASLEVGGDSASITRTSRTPSVALIATPATTGPVVVRGAAGQPYTLQTVDERPIGAPGAYWIGAATFGMGGDEIPPTLLLERRSAGFRPPEIVASTAPQLGPGQAWHGQFNLRGPSSLIFQTLNGVALTVRTSGLDMANTLSATRSLPDDFYELALEPKPGAQGAADVQVGAAGAPPAPLPPRWPANPVVPLGIQTVALGQSFRLSANHAPGTQVRLSYRSVPVNLVEGPLLVTVTAGTSVTIPVALASGGALAVNEVGGGPIAFGQQGSMAGGTTVVIPISAATRTVALAWRPTPAAPPPIPDPPAPERTAALQGGTPVFLDLLRGEQRGFSLTVPQGGQYRVETLGRLHTAGQLATAFIPQLGTADGNGVGQNMLIQSMLRAGRYRVNVSAIDSAGHLGVAATPASLLQTAPLRPGGSVRATVPAGDGVAVPLQVDNQARYHLDAASLGAAWAGRLEDPDGWPVTRPGALDGLEQALQPGQYRLLLQPDVVARRVALRLTPVVVPAPIEGHGPHALPFAQSVNATWREPDARDQPRAPDQWRFHLAGPAPAATLTLGDGMVGSLRRDGAPPIRVVGTWQGALEAGDYTLDATSLGRNDRLAYSVRIDTEALQPDTPRPVGLPASIPFALADSRVVSLTSWGNTPVRAVLRRADGGVVGRYGARPDDWNFAVSRRLAAGRYVLDVSAAIPPGTSTVGNGPGDASSDDDTSDQPDDEPAAQTSATTGAAEPAAKPADSDDSQPSDSSAPDTPDTPAPTVAVTLALPPDLPPAAAPTAAAELAGRGVHVLSLPPAAPGQLVVASATGAATLVLALERQDAAGWRTVAIDTGRSASLASPADADPAAWRVSAWSVDGGPDPITLAARVLDAPAQPEGAVQMAAVSGLPTPLAVARVRLDAPGLTQLAAPAGTLAAARPGYPAARPDGSTVLAPGTELWLLAPQPGPATLAPRSGDAVTVSVPAGLEIPLPVVASPGGVAVWRADSGLGQPGLGADAGLAEASAVALASQPATLRNARLDGPPLRLQLTRHDLKLAAPLSPGAALQATLSPGAAQPVSLPAGDKQLQLDLAPGVAAFAGWQGGHPVTAWAGSAPITRTLDGAWGDVLLVNTGTQPAAARLAWQPAPAAAVLQPGGLVRRFYGAAGSFGLAVDGPAAARLHVAGNAQISLVRADGTSQSGTDLALDGPARAVVTHAAGPLAVWLDAPGVSPWPEAAGQAVALPARLPLAGAALAVAVTPDQPSLLRVSTTTPVLLGVGDAPPRLFGNGAEFALAAAGPVQLRFYTAADGPLTGTATITAAPVLPLQEGVGAAVNIAPGGGAVFGFTLARAATVGVGVRTQPDQASVRLLDAAGQTIGSGVAQLHALAAGRYFLEASVPPDGAATLLQPALVGTTPRGSGPPPEVAQSFYQLVGMQPEGASP